MKDVSLSKSQSFEWDEGNSTKSWIKHRVSTKEQEQAFFSKEKIIVEDEKHSTLEKRFLLYSTTNKGRKLVIAFTVRTIDKQEKIRPISARSMNKKEARLYEKTIKMA